MRLCWGTVEELLEEDEQSQRLRLELDDGSHGEALVYVGLTGACVLGERVLANTTAVDLSLGTGGLLFIVARAGAGSGVVFDAPSGGHVMKLRYTPLQVDVVSVESPESPHHDVMSTVESIGDIPVVCCGLHSQAPLVAAAVKAAEPEMRVVYCMTDQAALCMPLSRVVRASVSAGLFDATISCGQAWGGDLEAVNVHSGLLAARHVAGADVIIAAIGPGVVGTATPLGHGGVAQGETINAVGGIGGTPVACLRISFADSRERHRGVSHHTLTALSKVAQTSALVAVPRLAPDLLHAIEQDLENAGVWERHRRADSDLRHLPTPDLRGVHVTTMGRDADADPAFFSAAFAAGSIASRVARSVL